MTRDDEGLPDNLSPLDLHVFSWADTGGIHVAFFDHEAWQKTPEGGTPLDVLDLASYVLSLAPMNAYRLGEALVRCANVLISTGSVPLLFDPVAPAPFPPDARHRLYARQHGLSEEQMERGGLRDDESGTQFPHPWHQEARPLDPKEGLVFQQIDEILGRIKSEPADPGEGF